MFPAGKLAGILACPAMVLTGLMAFAVPAPGAAVAATLGSGLVTPAWRPRDTGLAAS